MTPQQRLILARYLSRWAYLNLAWLITVLSASGASFSALGRQGALIALVLINAVWLSHVLLGFADTGTLPDNPPSADPQPPPEPPKPVTPPDVPPAPAPQPTPQWPQKSNPAE